MDKFKFKINGVECESEHAYLSAGEVLMVGYKNEALARRPTNQESPVWYKLCLGEKKYNWKDRVSVCEGQKYYAQLMGATNEGV